MDENRVREKNDEIEIDIQRLVQALLRKSWIICFVAVLCAAAMFAGTFFLVAPKYQSSAMFYVNNNALSLGEASVSINSGDISASRSLVKSYIVILETRQSLNDVIDYAGVDRTYEELKGMIDAAAVNSTEIFEVVVTSTDPVEAEQIADAIAHILPKRISSIIEGTSAKIVDYAVIASRPSSPNYMRNAMLGFAGGFIVMAAFFIIREITDITIRSEEDIARSCKEPVLAAVPDMLAHGKGGYYRYGYKKYSKYDKYGKASAANADGEAVLVGGGISFAASEAYKLLRTKLQFSFADEKNSRVIGVSSALTGEGKSLSAVNLAYTLSQLGKRTLLIDCDMRRPSVADKLPVKQDPGLSDFLAGQCRADSLIQLCGLKGEEKAFHVISAGRIPPNPMELLSSARMEKMLMHLRENYDYIILDLPPVNEVSDALAVGKYTDGMLIVVRQNYCDRLALSAAIHQFDFVESRLLGIVFNCTLEGSAGYGNKYYRKYYRKYYNKYYRAYGKKAYSYGYTRKSPYAAVNSDSNKRAAK